MKKIIALLLALVMALLCFAACDKTEPEQPETDPLKAARDYIAALYRDKDGTKSQIDFTVVAAVRIDGKAFPITWTVDKTDYVTVTPNEDGKTVLIDINEKPSEEVTYTLTATVSDENGKAETYSFSHVIPAFKGEPTYAELVQEAYGLADGESIAVTRRLYGEIVKIDTPYSEQYGNITVTIVIDGLTEQPIQCYRLKGEGAADLKVGDKITVEGTLKNYKGTIEFDSGCILIGHGDHPSQKATLDAAYALADGESIPTPSVLKGEIISIDTAYSADYGNITVTIVVDGDTERPIQCYRLKGEGAAELAVGDVITVVGKLKNYKGTYEFDAGCVLTTATIGEVKAVLAAYEIEEGASATAPSTMTGTITEIDTPYSEDYKNITVIISVGGLADYPIMCYRLKGEGAAELAVGDVITVTGTIKNYKGTIEFDAGCTFTK